MSTEAKTLGSAAGATAGKVGRAVLWPPSPTTLEERLHCIESMGERITGFVRFMCQVGSLNGTSGEAKEAAVRAFYERMLVVERQLGRIHDDLRLG